MTMPSTSELRRFLLTVSDDDFEKFLKGYSIGAVAQLLIGMLPPAGRIQLIRDLREGYPTDWQKATEASS